jgi:ABC-2 type transport system permease protein
VNGPGLVGAAVQVADLGWRQALRSKLLIGVGLAIAFAIGMAVVIHQNQHDSDPALDHQAMQVVVLSTVVVPLVALLLGTGAMAAERESGTLSFLFARPFPRSAVVLGKALAAIAVVNVAVVVCTLGVWLALGAPAQGQLAGGLAALMLEGTALTAVFVLFGTLLARSLYLGLAYVVFVEGVLGNLISARSGYTVTYHARNLLGEWSSGALRGNTALLPALPESALQSVLTLLVVTVAALAAACLWVEKREYGLKDRPKEE